MLRNRSIIGGFCVGFGCATYSMCIDFVGLVVFTRTLTLTRVTTIQTTATADSLEHVSHPPGALKLVGEGFPWAPGSCFAYTRDNHNSVLGIRSQVPLRLIVTLVLGSVACVRNQLSAEQA